MRIVQRHPAPFVLVLSAFATLGAVFMFAHPEYQPQYESKMVDFSTVGYTSPARARAAFVAEGIRLPYASRFSGMTTLSRVRLPQASALQVVVGPRTGIGSFGPRLEPYDERFDNVLVTYGGRDEKLLARVEAAVARLR